MKRQKVYLGLLLIDLVWSLAAFIYDFPVIKTMPPWSWIFCVICPLYPLLLALIWWNLWQGKSRPLLQAFAVLPSIIYGALALLFYPLLMAKSGFSWLLIGQILWVEVYAMQGVFLFFQRPILPKYLLFVAVFLSLALYIQNISNSFGYLSLVMLSAMQRSWLLAFGVGLSLVLVFFSQIKAFQRA